MAFAFLLAEIKDASTRFTFMFGVIAKPLDVTRESLFDILVAHAKFATGSDGIVHDPVHLVELIITKLRSDVCPRVDSRYPSETKLRYALFTVL